MFLIGTFPNSNPSSGLFKRWSLVSPPLALLPLAFSAADSMGPLSRPSLRSPARRYCLNLFALFRLMLRIRALALVGYGQKSLHLRSEDRGNNGRTRRIARQSPLHRLQHAHRQVHAENAGGGPGLAGCCGGVQPAGDYERALPPRAARPGRWHHAPVAREDGRAGGDR